MLFFHDEIDQCGSGFCKNAYFAKKIEHKLKCVARKRKEEVFYIWVIMNRSEIQVAIYNANIFLTKMNVFDFKFWCGKMMFVFHLTLICSS